MISGHEGDCSFSIAAGDTTGLIEAINTANSNGVPDTICLAEGSTYTLTAANNSNSEGANGLPVITSNITFEGHNATIIRSGSAKFRFLEISGSGVVIINQVNFTNGIAGSATNASGGAIYTYGILTVTNSTFSNNSSPDNGGGAILGRGTDSQLSIANTSFINNMAEGAGGALVWQGNNTATIVDSIFSGNTTAPNYFNYGAGGAIYASGPFTVTGTTFSNNWSLNGGAIKSIRQAEIYNSTLDNNTARYRGGAIFIEGGTLTISGSIVSNNGITENVGAAGGAIELHDDINLATGGDIHITNSCIVGNTSPSLNSTATAAREAQNNWWGASDGPSAGGVLGGDGLPNSFNYIPFLTTPPMQDCPVLPIVTPTQNVNVVYRTATALTLAPYSGLQPYSYELSSPLHGTLTGTAPNLTYTPTGNYQGTDSFTYTVTGANGSSTTGTVNITIVTDLQATNPTIEAENNPAGIPITLSQTGGWPPFSYTVLTNPTHGVISGTAPNLIYTPNDLFTGADSFTFQVTDEGGYTSTGTVNLTVTWDLDAQDQTLYLPFNTPVNVTLNTAGGNTPFIYSDISTPSSGSLTGTAPDLVYTPNNGFTGTETITFKVTDTTGFSDTGTITIHVAPSFVTTDQFLYGASGTPKAITLQTSGGRQPYSYSINTPPANGTLSGTAPNLTYNYNTGFSGLDSFTYTVTDANGSTASGTVKITTGPTLFALNPTIFTPFQTGVILPNMATGGQPPYTFSFVEPTIKGTISGELPNLVYTPQAGYSGAHQITFIVTDANGYQTTGRVNVTVGQPLSAATLNLLGQYNTPLVVTLAPAGGLPPYQYSDITTPAHGVLTGTAPDLLYTPNDGFSGSDTFTVTVTDAANTTVTATVNISISAPVTIPAGNTSVLIAAIQAANTQPGPDTIILSPGTYTLNSVNNTSALGPNGLPLISGELLIQGNGATITRANGSPIFRLFEVNIGGNLTLIDLTLSNGDAGSNKPGGGVANQGTLLLINVTVSNNRAWVGGGIFNQRASLLIRDSRILNNTATVDAGGLYNGATNGTVAGTQAIITGSTIAGNQATTAGAGTGRGGGIFNSAILTITNSLIVNNSSYAQGGGLYTGGTTNVVINVTNSCIAGNTKPGVYKSGSTGSGSFANNWWGSADGPTADGSSFTYGSYTPFLTAPILGCPEGIDQTVYTAFNQPVPLTLAAAGGIAPHTFSIHTNPTNGTLTGSAPNLTYTPNAGFSGQDRILFNVLDSNGLPGLGIVTVQVAPALTANSAVIGAAPNTPANITLTVTGGREPYTFGSFSTPAHGTLTGTAPDMIYTPDTDYVGEDSFTYTVTDANGSTTTGTITLIMSALQVTSQSVSTNSSTSLPITLGVTGGATPYTFSIVTQPENGYVYGTGPDVTYSPNSTFVGTDSFTFEVRDQIGTTAQGTITIDVTASPGATIVVNSTDQEVPFITNGNCTLGEALEAASTDVAVDGCAAGGEIDIIEVPAGIYELAQAQHTNAGGTRYALRPIGRNITIRGAGMDETIIRSVGDQTKIIFYNTGTLTLEGLTIAGGNDRRGSAIYNSGTLRVNQVRFKDNTADTEGAAIYAEHTASQITVQNSIFENNRATFKGATIMTRAGTLTVYNSVFYNNGGILPGPSVVDATSIWAVGNVTAQYNCFLDVNGPTSVAYFTSSGNPPQMNAQYNWWNETVGDSSTIKVSPKLTAPPSICSAFAPNDISVPAGDTAKLIEAMEYARSSSMPVTIRLAADSVYTLTQPYSTSPGGNSGLPTLDGDITFEGNNAIIERSTEPGTPDFGFMGFENGTMTIRNLTFRNGRSRRGGAFSVSNHTTITFENITFLNNQATGTDPFDGGGALQIAGMTSVVTIQNSHFEGNSAKVGGAIEVRWVTGLNINDTIFTQNQSSSGGGSIFVVQSGNVNLADNCFVYNSSPSVLNDINNNGNRIINAANNWWGSVDGPSGVAPGSGDAVSLQVTYEPFVTTKPADCPAGPVVAADQSLSMHYYDPSLPVILRASGGIPGYTFSILTSPAHGTLTGTPPNLTYMPEPGYAGSDSFTFTATDSADNAATGEVLILIETTSILVNSDAQEMPFMNNGNCTLGEAIQAANTDTAVDACPAGDGDDIIELTAGTYTLSQPNNITNGANGLPSITSVIAIVGNGAIIERSSASGTTNFRLFHVSADGALELNNLTLRNGRLQNTNYDTDRGGAIYSAGALTLNDVTIRDNSVSYDGGAVYAGGVSQSFMMVNSLITDNQAGAGGGLWICAPATIIDSAITENTAQHGGGIFNMCSTITISDSEIRGNIATSTGGGVATRGNGEHYIITDTILADNHAGTGSAIANNRTGWGGSTVNITNSCILDRTSSAVYDDSSGGITAAGNWWGSSTGPGGIGPGYGSTIVGQHVTFAPFLTEPILGCGLLPPVAIDQTVYTAYETATSITLSGVDGEAPYSFIVLTQPGSGVLTGTAPDLTYTPNDDFIGQDSFTYQVTDNQGKSDNGTIMIQVAPVLVAQNKTVDTAYQTAVTVNLSASGGRSPYVFTINQQPEYGTLSGSGSAFTYTPDSGFSGDDTFDFQVTDANGSTSTATVTVKVDTQLTAGSRDWITFQNTSLPITFGATGGKPPYKFTIVTNPSRGVIYQNGHSVTYVPRTDYIGFDSFTFLVTDAANDTATGTMNIAVNSNGANTPANLAIVNTARPTFRWTTFAGATQYRLQADTDESFDEPVVDVRVNSTVYTIPPAQPELDQGEYHWRVAAIKGDQEIWSNIPSFTVFLGTSPTNRSFMTNTRPRFTWSAVAGATGYRLQIDDDTDFTNDLIIDLPLGVVTAYAMPSALPYGTYYWRVLQADELPNDDLYWSFTITNSPLPAPLVTAPTVSLITGDTTVEIGWNAVTNAAGYEVQVDNNAAFATALEFTTTTDGATQVTTTALPDGVYYLRVRTLNSYGAPGAWSVRRAFTVDTSAPLPPVLSVPAANAISRVSRPTFVWGAAVGATQYQIVIDTDAACDAVPSPPQAGRSYIMPASLAQGSYFWCVRSLDRAGNVGAWSIPRSFSVHILTSPADGVALVTAAPALSPTLVWAAVPGATGYTVQIDTDPGFSNPISVPLGLVTTYRVNPALSYGTYYWQVIPTGVAQTEPVYRRFSITPNLLPAPIVTAPTVSLITGDTTVEIGWNAVTNAVGYEVQVDNNAAFATALEFTTITDGATQVTTTALPDGVYYLRVRTLNSYGAPGAWSVRRAFTVDTSAPLPPVLSVPAVNAISRVSRPTFVWGAAVGATQYQIVIDTDAACDAVPSPPQAGRSYIMPASLAQGSYFWCVRSLDRAGNVGVWSIPRSFSVHILTSPADGAALVTSAPALSPTLVWAAVPGATGYTVQIDTDPGFSNPISVPLGLVTAYRVNPALGYGTYYWQVIPTGVAQTEPVYRRFSITPNLLPAPLVTAPTVSLITSDTTVEIGWNAVTNAVGYEVQVDNNAAFATALEFTTTTDGATQVTTTVLPDGVYYLRVRTLNSYGAPGAWSVRRAFIVDTTAPLPPVLVAPVHSLVITNSRTPAFVWRASAQAAGYVLEIATDAEFTNIILAYNTRLTRLVLPPSLALPNGTYYWRVRAIDAATNEGAPSPANMVIIALP